MGVSSAADKLELVETDELLPARNENESVDETKRPEFRDPGTAVAIEEPVDADGSGSGIRTESSTAPPKSIVSIGLLFSFTITGFDLCQQRLVTA